MTHTKYITRGKLSIAELNRNVAEACRKPEGSRQHDFSIRKTIVKEGL